MEPTQQPERDGTRLHHRLGQRNSGRVLEAGGWQAARVRHRETGGQLRVRHQPARLQSNGRRSTHLRDGAHPRGIGHRVAHSAHSARRSQGGRPLLFHRHSLLDR